MNIKELQFFIETAKLKSMRLVAEKLYVTPQYVSKSIQNLENQLDIKLFQRNRYGVELTKEGESIYPFVQDVYKQLIYLYEVIPQEIKANKGNALSGVRPVCLNIGTSGNYAAVFVDILSILSEKYTNISPNMVSGESNDLVADLDNKDYDMIFCNATQKFVDSFDSISQKYTLHKVAQSEVYLFVNKFSPLAGRSTIFSAELADLPISFVRSNNEVTPLLLEILEDNNISPTISFTASSPQCLSDYFGKTNTYMLGASFLKRQQQKNKSAAIAVPISGLEPIWQILLIKKDIEEPKLAEDIYELLKRIF